MVLISRAMLLVAALLAYPLAGAFAQPPVGDTVSKTTPHRPGEPPSGPTGPSATPTTTKKTVKKWIRMPWPRTRAKRQTQAAALGLQESSLSNREGFRHIIRSLGNDLKEHIVNRGVVIPFNTDEYKGGQS